MSKERFISNCEDDNSCNIIIASEMPDFLYIKEGNEKEFKNIAFQLFNNYAIQNNDSVFRLNEIEFYWTSQNHLDESTYERKYVDPNTGEWFFHYSGVDIALRNDKIKGYGGILIRGIVDIKSNPEKPYKGPQVCAMKLFSGISAFVNSFPVRIIDYKFEEKKIKETIRIGLGKNAVKSGTDKLRYRFITQ